MLHVIGLGTPSCSELYTTGSDCRIESSSETRRLHALPRASATMSFLPRCTSSFRSAVLGTFGGPRRAPWHAWTQQMSFAHVKAQNSSSLF